MVVEAPAFVGVAVVEGRRRRGCGGDVDSSASSKPRLPVPHGLVVEIRHRVALRQFVHAVVDALGAVGDIVGLAQLLLHDLDTSRPCPLRRDSSRCSYRPVRAHVHARFARDALGQRIVPQFPQDDRTAGHVLVDPAAGRDPGVLAVVDAVDIGQRPEKAADEAEGCEQEGGGAAEGGAASGRVGERGSETADSRSAGA